MELESGNADQAKEAVNFRDELDRNLQGRSAYHEGNGNWSFTAHQHRVVLYGNGNWGFTADQHK
jgi:hypothetical protein